MINIKAHSVSLPPKSILDSTFNYRRSWETDRHSIAETMQKAREERRQKESQGIHIQIDNPRMNDGQRQDASSPESRG